jgi:hypothetical protein
MLIRLIPGLDESLAFSPDKNLRFEIEHCSIPSESQLSALLNLHVPETRGSDLKFRHLPSDSLSSLLVEYSWFRKTREVSTQTTFKKRRKRKHLSKRKSKRNRDPITAGVSIFKYLRIRESLVVSANSHQV